MKCMILDRDGVINEDSDDFIKAPEEWIPIPGSLEAIASLKQAGVSVFVVTNQSGLGRGLFDAVMLDRIHAKLNGMLLKKGGWIDSLFFCPHLPEDACLCRKPKTGLFEKVADFMGQSLSEVWCVGDALRDWQAAETAGGFPVLVRTGKGRATEALIPENQREGRVFNNLSEVVEGYLGRVNHPVR